MPTAKRHCIRSGLLIGQIILLTGCWEKIEYTGSTSPPASKPAADATAPATEVAQAKQATPAAQEIAPATTSKPEKPESNQSSDLFAPSTPSAPSIAAPPESTKTSTSADRYATPPKKDVPLPNPPASETVTAPAAAPMPPVDTSKNVAAPPAPAPARTPTAKPAAPATDRYATPPKLDDARPAAAAPASKPPAVSATQPKVPTNDTGGSAASAPARVAPRSNAPNTRRLAWRLGSRLSQAALANDRGMDVGSVNKWFDEAAAAARLLGTTIPDLPESAAAFDGGQASQRVLDYLGIQFDRIARDLSKNNNTENAALFEIALKTNILVLLYSPGNSSAASVSSTISRAAPQAKLPAELWQPLVDMLRKQTPVDDVRAAIRKMHKNVDEYLANSAESGGK